MFLNFFKNKIPDNLLALDIGTEYVKALVFGLNDEGDRIVVKGMVKERQDPKNMAGGMITDIEGVSSTCKRAVSRAEDIINSKLTSAIIGVAGEAVRGGVVTVHYERANAEEKITVAEIKNIIQRVQWRAFDKFRKDFAEDTGKLSADVRIVDAHILKIKIDGYEVANPVDFQGKTITFEIFNSVAPLVHLSSIQNVTKNLGLRVERIAAEPCAIANLACLSNAASERSLFIDIGGGTTDIAVVKGGAIDAVRMFSMGGRALSKRLSASLGIGDIEAEDIKIKYSSGKLGKDASSSIHNILKEDIRIWIKGVRISLEKFLGGDFVPSSIYLCGGGCLVPEIKEALLNSLWDNADVRIDVCFLFPNLFENKIMDNNSILTDTSDVASLGLANLASSAQDSIVNQSLKRAVRLMQP